MPLCAAVRRLRDEASVVALNFPRTSNLAPYEFLVAEADESDRSFLKLSPILAVVTNIDREHLDHYKDLDDIRQAFTYFANRVPFYGVTVLCVDDPHVRSILPHVTKGVQYNVHKDFTAIALMATNFMALAVGGNSSFKTVNDLVQHAKQNPGKASFGSNGEGAFLHFATELFRSTAGFTYLHVPFKGFPQLAGDLVSGRLDASFGSFPAVLPFTQAGRVRILGIARDKRLPNYPNIPTISESLPGYFSGGWFGLVGPAGIPKHIVAQLNQQTNAALAAPDVREKLSSQGLDLFAETPEYFAKYIRDDFARYGRIAKEIGLVAK